jgi:AGCS family alanine or glycine:cation symporter
VAESALAAPAAPKEALLAKINNFAFGLLFRDVSFGAFKSAIVDEAGNPVLADDGSPDKEGPEVPFLVALLLGGALFFTLWYRFINFRGFSHALQVVAGKFDNPEDKGEISHFRALTSALSATVGLGNIAGVAIAIRTGGPGAVFWMWVAAIFGMSAKFSSCTLAQLYRQENKDGSISGGPMYYLDLGLKDLGLPMFGKVLGVVFAVMVMCGAIGGGNMFQANQTVEVITDTFKLDMDAELTTAEFQALVVANPANAEVLTNLARDVNGTVHLHLDDLNAADKVALGDQYGQLKSAAGMPAKWGIGIIMAILAGVVILGGIKRIGAATSKIVPLMCGLYVLASLFVLLTNASGIPACFGVIFQQAFTGAAMGGGLIGVMVVGIQRAAFSNEAGLGSAAIAHAAAKTDEPVREGMVAMIGPFIDTIVVCTMTALVVIITGAWQNPELTSASGVSLTSAAFKSSISWFPYVLTACVALFAYSTLISWCYYGERGWIYLLDHVGEGIGLKSVVVFRLVFVLCIIVGAINSLTDVLNFSDVMILSMCLPNILGSIILAPTVFRHAKDYLGRLKSGEIKPVK